MRSRSRGFTLVEVLIASALSGIILAGVLSAVLMIARSGYLLNNYTEMEKEARTALETIAVDARITETISWHRTSETSPLTGITLTPPSGSADAVRYDYDSVNGILTRTASGKSRTLVSGIQSLTFNAYRYTDGPGPEIVVPATTSTTSLNGVTKMLQISLSSVRSRTSLVDATNNVVSARYVLRNKVQTN
ncbi:MAG: hypothetical protein K0R17_3000 [Rariglobus sp.]|jgi:prepilin-type N-terminal cleavage/methylation domain-containing protein|nr:hypothetical protein [Rariglobus sp.]